jgi:hypothetical protein
MGIRTPLICSASASAAGPESAAQEDAASAPLALMMGCEFRASAVLADVKMITSPREFAIATAVLFELPDEEVEVDVVPSRAPAAAAAASPEENVVVTTRAFWPSARAVAFVNESPPSWELDVELVGMLRGADGLRKVSCVLYALPFL